MKLHKKFDNEPDQGKRLRKMRQVIERHGGTIAPLGDMPADVEEGILRSILDVESAMPISLWDLLTHKRVGLDIPEPDELDDARLTAKLREIINRMARLKAYLLYTNHLSDRELYELLYYDALPAKSALLSMNCAFVMDCTGCAAGSPEGRQIFLRYYADEEQRREWASKSNEPIPEHADPPFDRDRFLPNAPQP